jgi:hypothetical protein
MNLTHSTFSFAFANPVVAAAVHTQYYLFAKYRF